MTECDNTCEIFGIASNLMRTQWTVNCLISLPSHFLSHSVLQMLSLLWFLSPPLCHLFTTSLNKHSHDVNVLHISSHFYLFYWYHLTLLTHTFPETLTLLPEGASLQLFLSFKFPTSFPRFPSPFQYGVPLEIYHMVFLLSCYILCLLCLIHSHRTTIFTVSGESLLG